MLDNFQCWGQVRFRTEKSLFSGVFAGKFFAGDPSNQTLAALNKEGVCGLVR
jgi:hypothetical protein